MADFAPPGSFADFTAAVLDDMTYLILTHVPFFTGQSPGVYRASAPWIADLRAAVDALKREGFDVHVASPLVDQIDKRTAERYEILDISPQKLGFSYIPVPACRTMTQFVAQRSLLRKTLRGAMQKASIVQLGHGGHPLSMGAFGWSLAGQTTLPRIWQFDASDPFPQLEKYAEAGHNPAKRLGKQMMLKSTLAACRKATREADLVFCHRPQLLERFSELNSHRVHMLPWSGLHDGDLATEKAFTQRLHRLDQAKSLRFALLLHPTHKRGIEHLIRGLGKAYRLGARVQLDLVGQSAQPGELVQLLRDESIESVTTIHGVVAQGQSTWKILDAVDLGLVAGLGPETPDVLHWMLARALPIAGLDGGALTGFRAAGRLLPRGELNLLSEAILDLSRNRLQLADFSHNARHLASASTLEAIHATRAKLARQAAQGRKVEIA